MEREELILGITADIADAEANLATLQGQLDELQTDWDLPALEADLTVQVENAQTVVDDLNAELEAAGGLEATVDVDSESIATADTRVGELETSLRNIPVVGSELGDVVQSLDDIGAAAERGGGLMTGLLGGLAGLGLVSAAINAASAAWSWFSGRADEARRKAEEFAAAQRDVADALAEADVESAATQLVDLYGDAYDAAKKAGVPAAEFTKFLTGMADEMPSVVAAAAELSDAPMNEWGAGVSGARRELVGLNETMVEARHQYRETNGTIGEQNVLVEEVAGALDGAAASTAGMAGEQQAAANALGITVDELDAAKQGALDYATAVSSVDWQAAELEGAATAMSQYTTSMFALPNAVQASETAFAALNEAIGDGAVNFDTTTEAGRKQQDALEGVANVIDTELAQAYDAADGSQQTFMDSANELATNVLGKLQNDLGLTADEAAIVAEHLGLTTGDFEARYNLAGVEEARLQLGLMQGAIEGLPDDIELQVNALIAQGKLVEARDLAQSWYEDNPVLTPTEIDASGFIEGAEQATGRTPTAVFPTGADTEDAEGEMQDAADAAPDATIIADADTVAAADQLLDETSKKRVAVIGAAAHTVGAAVALNRLDDPRTAVVTAVAHTGAAEAELNHTARTRTSTIIARTVSGGSRSSSGGSVPQAVGSGRSAAPGAASAAPIQVTLNAAVIGDRYAVQRTVTRAVRGAVRLGGARKARAA